MAIGDKELLMCERHDGCLVIHEHECPVCWLQHGHDEIQTERDVLQDLWDEHGEAE